MELARQGGSETRIRGKDGELRTIPLFPSLNSIQMRLCPKNQRIVRHRG